MAGGPGRAEGRRETAAVRTRFSPRDSGERRGPGPSRAPEVAYERRDPPARRIRQVELGRDPVEREGTIEGAEPSLSEVREGAEVGSRGAPLPQGPEGRGVVDEEDDVATPKEVAERLDGEDDGRHLELVDLCLALLEGREEC